MNENLKKRRFFVVHNYPKIDQYIPTIQVGYMLNMTFRKSEFSAKTSFAKKQSLVKNNNHSSVKNVVLITQMNFYTHESNEFVNGNKHGSSECIWAAS